MYLEMPVTIDYILPQNMKAKHGWTILHFMPSGMFLREWSVLTPGSWSSTLWLRKSCSEERRSTPWPYLFAGKPSGHIIHFARTLFQIENRSKNWGVPRSCHVVATNTRFESSQFTGLGGWIWGGLLTKTVHFDNSRCLSNSFPHSEAAQGMWSSLFWRSNGSSVVMQWLKKQYR